MDDYEFMQKHYAFRQNVAVLVVIVVLAIIITVVLVKAPEGEQEPDCTYRDAESLQMKDDGCD